jgi:predicted ATPase
MINVNSNWDFFKDVDITKEKEYPIFLTGLKFEPFRHIPKLEIKFQNPISVIAGTNRSGKSTVLMALACSHTDFQKRNPKNGKLERNTWSSIMKFTQHDTQIVDWDYFITYKTGKKTQTKAGKRKQSTKKWSGIGKKESQFKMRQVVFIDLDRVVPARFYNDKIYSLSKRGTLSAISSSKVAEIESYMSFILEEKFEIKKIAQHLDKEVFKYENTNHYSSFNAATGEEVLTRIIIDIVEAPTNSLLLIDEVEMGLHPKIQRRVLDVIREVSKKENKQFIITTHSSTILDSVCDSSRIFIEKNHKGEYRAIQNISVNAALTKMDAKSYPLIDLYCEDKEAKWIINKAIAAIEKEDKINGFSNLINIIISGSSNKTYTHFISHSETFEDKKIRSGFGCILDGDMKNMKTSKGDPSFPPHENLHFLYSNECPEKFLTREFLSEHYNVNIEYYLENENPHYLFEAIINNSSFNTVQEVLEECWRIFLESDKGKIYFKALKKFLMDMAKKYSPEL